MEPAGSGKRTRIYTLETYKLKNGTQLPRLHEYFSQTLLPLMAKVHTGPKIYLEALVAPHVPQVAAIYGFASLDEMLSLRSEALKAADALESGPEPAFESMDITILEATDYSPEISVPTKASKIPTKASKIPTKASKPPRLFELRVYHSPTHRQLKALHERFAGPEIPIFHRVGLQPMLYSSTLVGPNLPNLTYLIPFDDLAAREKAWNAFNADPEWIKVRKESIDRSGQIASVMQISLWKATAYSPIC